tara:strand:+ start:291 stop:998 length:708 start_codon:yes stop_codon:yes gene_type:complete
MNLISCSGLKPKFSKSLTKERRFPASKKSGFKSSHIGSDVGTIKYSMLKKSTFQKIHGKSWVLMDGRCVESECCKDEKKKLEKTKNLEEVTCDDSKDSDYYHITNHKRIPKAKSSFENTYSARIKNNYGENKPTKLSESTPFIEDVRFVKEGVVSIHYKPGFFTEIPAVIAVGSRINSDSVDIMVQKGSESISGCTIVTNYKDALTMQNHDFNLLVQRQGSDYRRSNVFIKINDD